MQKMESRNKYLSLALATIFILATLASQASSSRSLPDASMIEKHEQWMSRYGRVYHDAAEKENRYNIFKRNMEYIESSNKISNKPYKLGVNQFADLTNEEFKSRNKFKSHVCSTTRKTFKYQNSSVPATVDWRKNDAVTPVKDQGQCGEDQGCQVPEQELVDCDTSGEDQGCQGGLMDDAFNFIVQNKGLNTEVGYPYTGTDGTCNKKEAESYAAKINGHEDVPANSENALLKAVANQPVSVAIDAGGSDFQYYSSGVFTGECETQLDHGVTVVGYGTAEDGTKYWLVKNSWGASWGEEGYMRMQRDVEAKEGLCGIAMQASYPTA